MTVTLQNLRSVTPGFAPPSLLQGQICFNLVDEIMFVGDGSSYQTDFSGVQTPTTAGTGWFSLPLNLSGFSQYLLQNPEFYGDVPTNGQVLSYSSVLQRAVWEDAQGAINPTVYTTTDAAVSAAPGATTSAKISNALGVTPVEADSAIVTGLPGTTYQGLYLFQSGAWVFAAGYADPTAIQVPYSNTVSGLLAATVQAAIDELTANKLNKATNTPTTGQVLSWGAGSPLWVDGSAYFPTATQVTYDNSVSGIPSTNVQGAITLTWQKANEALSEANSAQSDATSAQNTANIALQNSIDAVTDASNALIAANNAVVIASTALPLAGGTMTGNIIFNNGQPVDAGLF